VLDNEDETTLNITQQSLENLDTIQPGVNYTMSPNPDLSRTSSTKHTPSKMEAEKKVDKKHV
jgi:hypothetical protein